MTTETLAELLGEPDIVAEVTRLVATVGPDPTDADRLVLARAALSVIADAAALGSPVRPDIATTATVVGAILTDEVSS